MEGQGDRTKHLQYLPVLRILTAPWLRADLWDIRGHSALGPTLASVLQSMGYVLSRVGCWQHLPPYGEIYLHPWSLPVNLGSWNDWRAMAPHPLRWP